MKKPLIFITNDDGIFSPGIAALIDVMKSLGDVVVVAPDKVQSGMGHAITLNSTLRVNEIKIEKNITQYSCNGTPVDCVKLAMKKFLPRKPDLLVSGINHGYNSSINVIYSGTMSAAVEGALENIPSIGFSLGDYDINADFTASKHIAKIVSKNALKHGMPVGTCLNVNIPPIGLKEINGIKVCRQANANWEEDFDERIDPNGKKYYWLAGVLKNYDKGKDTDEWNLKNNFATIVPIQFDMTAHKAISEIKKWKNTI